MILDLEAFIPAHHVARVIDKVIEDIPDKQLFAHYTGGGRSSYHPKMMLSCTATRKRSVASRNY